MGLFTVLVHVSLLLSASAFANVTSRSPSDHRKVIILGGGVAGVIAARTLHEKGIDDFLIVEARSELGGRVMSHSFAGKTVEAGATWIEGTQTGNGPENPIYGLAKKHNLQTYINDFVTSTTTYDSTGAIDYHDVFNNSLNDFNSLIVEAGTRVSKGLVDINSRTGYSLVGAKPKDPHAEACEYYQFDWEFGQDPEETSLIASIMGGNYTYNTEAGGYSDDSLLSIDQRGFKAIVQDEAAEFLTASQVLLSSTVTKIAYTTKGVNITLSSGESLIGDYALCTFSLGVLQNDDVTFHPKLPAYKEEAIQSMSMATYTKIFLHFPQNFWFDTQFGLYADKERGRYPVWQSLDHVDFFPGSGILYVTVTGDFAKRIEAFTDSEIQAEVMGVLRFMFPAIQIPDPLEIYFPRWYTDPLYRGAFSNWPASFYPEHHENLRATVAERLWFAGEATSKKYFGFLQGAYFEGLEVATDIANCIHGKHCKALGHVEEVRSGRSYT